MNKIKIKTLFIISIMVFFVFGTKQVKAGVIINEIQINPTAERFVELYNDSDTEIDLTGYYLQRKTSTSDKYTSFVTSTKLSGKKIPSKGFFLVTKELLGLESLTITESNSIQLKNSKQQIVYKIGMGDSNDCGGVCVPNPKAGNSVQRISEDNWIEGVPTPGEKNLSFEQEKEEEDTNEENSLDDLETKEKEKIILNPSIVTKIISPKIVVAGVPFVINHKTIGYKNEQIIHDRFVWNFGDGNFKEMNPCLPFSYTYLYPGDYVLSLSYYETFFSEIPEATNKMNIKVIPSGINIVSIGNINDPYVELENSSSHEMILNKWSIVGNGHTFVIPDGTTILPNKKIKFSPRITGFKIDDLVSLKIVDNEGTLFASYPKIENFKITKSVTLSNKSEPLIHKENNNKELELNSQTEMTNLNKLTSSAYDSGKSNNSGVFYLGLLLVISLGIMVIITIRKENKENSSGLEKDLSANDIKIIE